MVELAREAADQHGNGEDARVQHQAELALGERCEGDLACQKLGAGGEDGEDDSAEGEDLATDGAEEDVACVALSFVSRCDRWSVVLRV